jgi:hypothetical protein
MDEVKEHMQRIRADAVMFQQEGVVTCVHRFVARNECGITAEQVRHPPGLKRAVARKTVGDPQPLEDPARVGSPKVESSGTQTDSDRSEVK